MKGLLYWSTLKENYLQSHLITWILVFSSTFYGVENGRKTKKFSFDREVEHKEQNIKIPFCLEYLFGLCFHICCCWVYVCHAVLFLMPPSLYPLWSSVHWGTSSHSVFNFRLLHIGFHVDLMILGNTNILPSSFLLSHIEVLFFLGR